MTAAPPPYDFAERKRDAAGRFVGATALPPRQRDPHGRFLPRIAPSPFQRMTKAGIATHMREQAEKRRATSQKILAKAATLPTSQAERLTRLATPSALAKREVAFRRYVQFKRAEKFRKQGYTQYQADIRALHFEEFKGIERKLHPDKPRSKLSKAERKQLFEVGVRTTPEMREASRKKEGWTESLDRQAKVRANREAYLIQAGYSREEAHILASGTIRTVPMQIAIAKRRAEFEKWCADHKTTPDKVNHNGALYGGIVAWAHKNGFAVYDPSKLRLKYDAERDKRYDGLSDAEMEGEVWANQYH